MIKCNADEFRKNNCTILNEKFQFFMSDLKILDFVCDLDNRSFETAKIIKILKWYCDITMICERRLNLNMMLLSKNVKNC